MYDSGNLCRAFELYSDGRLNEVAALDGTELERCSTTEAEEIYHLFALRGIDLKVVLEQMGHNDVHPFTHAWHVQRDRRPMIDVSLIQATRAADRAATNR